MSRLFDLRALGYQGILSGAITIFLRKIFLFLMRIKPTPTAQQLA